MTASQWERINTPAGQFLVLRIHSETPNFVSNDLFRVGNQRQEGLRFTPEIGRWVIRRSSGRLITAQGIVVALDAYGPITDNAAKEGGDC